MHSIMNASEHLSNVHNFILAEYMEISEANHTKSTNVGTRTFEIFKNIVEN